MNLNDPFNRLSKQQQHEYSKFRKSLKESSVNSQSAALALLKNIRQRTLFFSIAIVIAAVIIVFFIPKLKGIVIVFATIILLWLFAITFKGQRFIRRYIQEEFPEKS